MASLTDREKRTVRLAGIAIAVYLVLFFGVRAWRQLEGRRTEYLDLQESAQRLKRDLRPYENRILLTQKLRETLRMKPRAFSRNTLVAETSAALQREAASLKVQLGQVRETAARPSAKELASMQIEGVGPIPGVAAFLSRLEALGYPLIVDAIQLSGDPAKPGIVKLNISVVILDFDAWTTAEVPGA